MGEWGKRVAFWRWIVHIGGGGGYKGQERRHVSQSEGGLGACSSRKKFLSLVLRYAI